MKAWAAFIVTLALANVALAQLSSTGPNIVPTQPQASSTGASAPPQPQPQPIVDDDADTTFPDPVVSFPTDIDERQLSVTTSGMVEVEPDLVEIRASIVVKKYFEGANPDAASSSSTGASSGTSTPSSDASVSPDGPASDTSMPPYFPPSPDAPPDATAEQVTALIADVRSEASDRADTLITYLQGSDLSSVLSRLRTTTISLSPIYSYRSESDYKSRLVGYSATYSVSFRVTTASDRAGEIVDALTEHGATEVDGMDFVVSDALLQRTRQRAIARAAQNALREITAAVSGLSSFTDGEVPRTLQIVDIAINRVSYVPPPYPWYNSAGEASSDAVASPGASAAPTAPIVSGVSEVSAEVTVRVRF